MHFTKKLIAASATAIAVAGLVSAPAQAQKKVTYLLPAPAFADRTDDRCEVVIQQHHVRSLAGGVGAFLAHRDTNVGPPQRRRGRAGHHRPVRILDDPAARGSIHGAEGRRAQRLGRRRVETSATGDLGPSAGELIRFDRPRA